MSHALCLQANEMGNVVCSRTQKKNRPCSRDSPSASWTVRRRNM